MARDIVSGSAPVNVSAVNSGKKGKGKGKGKCEDKDKEAAANPDAEVVCHHRKGLRKRDCPTVEKEKPRKGQPVNAVEQAPARGAAASSTQVITLARISMVEMDTLIPMINADDHEMQVGRSNE